MQFTKWFNVFIDKIYSIVERVFVGWAYFHSARLYHTIKRDHCTRDNTFLQNTVGDAIVRLDVQSIKKKSEIDKDVVCTVADGIPYDHKNRVRLVPGVCNELQVRFMSLWLRSYSDLSVVGVLVCPYLFKMVIDNKSKNHSFMKMSAEDLKAAEDYVRTLLFSVEQCSDADWDKYWYRGYKNLVLKTSPFADFKTGSQDFWRYAESKNKYNEIKALYLRVECANPTSATVERLHSLYTALATKTKNRMKNSTLIKLAYLKFNTMYKKDKNKKDWISLRQFCPVEEKLKKRLKIFAN